MRYLLAFFLIVWAPFAYGIEEDPEAVAAFELEMQQELGRSQAEVSEFIDSMRDGDILITDAHQARLAFMVAMYTVKATIVSNFTGTPSLHSPEIRAELRRLLQADEITAADLAGLQRMVDDYRREREAAKLQESAAGQ